MPRRPSSRRNARTSRPSRKRPTVWRTKKAREAKSLKIQSVPSMRTRSTLALAKRPLRSSLRSALASAARSKGFIASQHRQPFALSVVQRLVRRQHRVLQRRADLRLLGGQRPGEQRVEQGTGAVQALTVLGQDGADADVHGRVVHPAVVVGGDAHRRIADLRLAREKDLGHVGHAHQLATDLAHEQAFGARAQARPFDAGVGDVAVQPDAHGRGLAGRPVDQLRAGRLRGRHMRGHALAEEASRAAAAWSSRSTGWAWPGRRGRSPAPGCPRPRSPGSAWRRRA